jgi:hypothetical protein
VIYAYVCHEPKLSLCNPELVYVYPDLGEKEAPAHKQRRGKKGRNGPSQGEPVSCAVQECAALIVALCALAYHYSVPHIARHPEAVHTVKSIGPFPVASDVLSIQVNIISLEPG